MANFISLQVFNNDGSEETVRFPAKWELCDVCEGEGKCENPAFSNGITSSERDQDWTDEEWDGYMNGDYDVRCDHCDGEGKVKVIDEKACKGELKEKLDSHYETEKEIRMMERIYESERRMGA